MTALRIGSATDVGLVRANNQDRLLVAEPLFAVADGMGGHAAGEVASATAVDALEGAFTELTPEGLQAAARAANRAVWDHAQTDPELRGMGTTLVALALVGPPGAEELAVANVGDSRLYLLSQGDLVQVTSDHSLVAELVAEGQIEPEEAEY
jgi:serine/threonine protein phosphatase PrpC